MADSDLAPTRRRVGGCLGGENAIEVFEASGPLPSPVPTLAHVHRDELTALAAARYVARERGARLVALAGERERRLTFVAGQSVASFDPNRAFTPRGREMTVASEESVRAEALRRTEAFALAFLAELGPGPWIAAHNNSPGPPLSIRSFLPGASDARWAAALHVAPDQTEDDFALVTTPALFDGYRAAGCNVVLQAAHIPDDGSLSVHAARQGVPYVNVEALEGHLEQQVRLLRLAFDLLAP